MSRSVEDELIAVAHDWDRAMVGNDAEAIGRFMADDWVIIGPDGRVGDKTTFLGLVKSGALTHDEMTSEDFHIRVYGDTAVISTRGVSGGNTKGSPSAKSSGRRACSSGRQGSGGAC